MRSELNGVFFVNLEKVGRYGNYNETWQEADHGITEQISDLVCFCEMEHICLHCPYFFSLCI